MGKYGNDIHFHILFVIAVLLNLLAELVITQ